PGDDRGPPERRPLRPAATPRGGLRLGRPGLEPRFRHTLAIVCTRAPRTAAIPLALQGDLLPRLRAGVPVQCHRPPSRRTDGLDGAGHLGPPGTRAAVLA